MDIWGFSSLVHSHNISFLEQIYKTYKFLEVECLGFCFHWDPKRKSLPQAAASALPLFIGEGELRKGLHVGLSRTLISKHLGAPPWSFQGGGVTPFLYLTERWAPQLVPQTGRKGEHIYIRFCGGRRAHMDLREEKSKAQPGGCWVQTTTCARQGDCEASGKLSEREGWGERSKTLGLTGHDDKHYNNNIKKKEGEGREGGEEGEDDEGSGRRRRQQPTVLSECYMYCVLYVTLTTSSSPPRGHHHYPHFSD